MFLQAFPFLATYAAGFVGFPIIRYFNIKRRNKEIRERNTERKKWFEIVNSMIALKKQSNQKEEINTTLLDKLKSREAYLDTQVRPRVKETPTKIVYDTDISLDQQETIK